MLGKYARRALTTSSGGGGSDGGFGPFSKSRSGGGGPEGDLGLVFCRHGGTGGEPSRFGEGVLTLFCLHGGGPEVGAMSLAPKRLRRTSCVYAIMIYYELLFVPYKGYGGLLCKDMCALSLFKIRVVVCLIQDMCAL